MFSDVFILGTNMYSIFQILQSLCGCPQKDTKTCPTDTLIYHKILIYHNNDLLHSA